MLVIGQGSVVSVAGPGGLQCPAGSGELPQVRRGFVRPCAIFSAECAEDQGEELTSVEGNADAWDKLNKSPY